MSTTQNTFKYDIITKLLICLDCKGSVNKDPVTGWGHPVVLCYKIHNICSYSQTQLSIMFLIKSTHLATGFDQTCSSSGHIYTKILIFV